MGRVVAEVAVGAVASALVVRLPETRLHWSRDGSRCSPRRPPPRRLPLGRLTPSSWEVDRVFSSGAFQP